MRSTSRSTRRLAASIPLFLCVLAAEVRADAVPASPFRGVRVPGGGVAGDADATALELSPGQLGLLSGGSGALLVDHWGSDVLRPGRGGALMLAAAPAGVLALGVGFHWLRPTLPGWRGDYQKLQAGLGLRLGRGAALGFGWDHLWNAGFAATNSYSIGLGLHLHPMLAAGFVVRDVGRPRLAAGAAELPREWDMEAALRPLGTDRLEIAGGVRLLQGGDFVALPRARLSARLRRGLRLFAEIDWPRYRFEETDWRGGTLSLPADYLATVGLTVEQNRAATTLAGFGNWRSSGGDSAGLSPGGSLMLRVLPARRDPLVAASYVARVKLEDLSSERDFVQQLVRLRQLGDDSSVGALLLEIGQLHIGLGRIEELRSLVAELRRRKPVFASLTEASTREYFLASACERIFIDPAGSVYLGGLAQTVTFYKGVLDRVGVHVDLVRIAEYKGAMEPFVLEEQSAPVRENSNALLDDGYGRLLEGVVAGRKGRGVDQERLRGLVDKAVFSADEAKAAGLADAVSDEEGEKAAVEEALGRKLPVRDADAQAREAGRWRPARVAVILVEGSLVEGDGGDFPFPSARLAWSRRITDAIEQARRDPSVRAVVLRVNSPGGSALASDHVARALARLRKAGKPVLASMGDVAASGGYYVSAPASEIFASPSTLTGSIGIYAYKVDVAGLLGHLGMTTETYRRGPHADLFSATRPWSEEERALISGRMRAMYERFLHSVAEGRAARGITAARADELGRGRVWTGAQAAGVRLVDRLGGLLAAIDEASRRGGVGLGPGGLPELVVLPKPPPMLLGLPRVPGGEMVERMLLPLLAEGASGIQARLPYDIDHR